MIKILDVFTFYGFDVMLLAALTAITVQICKVTFLKRVKRKLLTFLPFIFGIIYYAAYAALVHMDFYFGLNEYVSVIEHGFAVGTTATLTYVTYEQFIRDKKSVSPSEGIISALIAGYVPDERTESVAKSIAAAIERDVTGDGATRTAEILAENSLEDITESDIKLLARLIIEALAHANI